MNKCVVEICVDTVGKIYSLVRAEPYKREAFSSVVVDREKGRDMDAGTVISRAKALSTVTGIPMADDIYHENPDHLRGFKCNCPDCQGARETFHKKRLSK